jgi:hypothetical protein
MGRQNAAVLSGAPRTVACGIMSRLLATIATHADLVAAFRARIVELDVTHLGIDAVSGLADGHTSKLMCGDKGFGPVSLFAMLDALGCDLVLVENPAKLAAAEQAAKRLHVPKRRIGRPRREHTSAAA